MKELECTLWRPHSCCPLVWSFTPSQEASKQRMSGFFLKYIHSTDDICRFLTDYIHTFIILILCCYLTTKALTSVEVDSIGGLYDLVVAAQPNHLVDGNYQGSLFTMTSQQGIFFGIILLVSNFGAVIVSTLPMLLTASWC